MAWLYLQRGVERVLRIQDVAQSERANRSLGILYGSDIPTFQRGWELEQLINLFRKVNPRVVLEIGTFHGGTLRQWIQNIDLIPNPQIVSVDTYAAGVDNRHLFAEWVRNLTLDLVVVEGDSRMPDTIEKVSKYAPFDFIFIDADHYYDAVKLDWYNYRSMIKPGGIICFHDILDHPNHPEIEVRKLWQEIQQQGYLTQEIVENPDADWGGIGVVYF
jgi:predicted O-methyltransferase YrrM